jgi:L-fuconolactonase
MSTNSSQIPIIDAHVHLWDTQRLNYPWLKMVPDIDKNFLMPDFQQQHADFNIEKFVFVQADCHPKQFLEELEFVAEQALLDSRLQGIVAYAPLELGNEIVSILEIFQSYALVKGVRKMYDEAPDACLDPRFIAALRLLPAYNLSFDISIKPASVKQTLQMIKACPDTQFVLDHLGKPDIRNRDYNAFEKNLSAFASLPNVTAKLSGLITEADHGNWRQEDIQPYIEYAISAFGFDRLMFGSDWPVVLLAGSYQRWLHTIFKCVETCSAGEQNKLFYATANKLYRL